MEEITVEQEPPHQTRAENGMNANRNPTRALDMWGFLGGSCRWRIKPFGRNNWEGADVSFRVPAFGQLSGDSPLPPQNLPDLYTLPSGPLKSSFSGFLVTLDSSLWEHTGSHHMKAPSWRGAQAPGWGAVGGQGTHLRDSPLHRPAPESARLFPPATPRRLPPGSVPSTGVLAWQCSSPTGGSGAH